MKETTKYSLLIFAICLVVLIAIGAIYYSFINENEEQISVNDVEIVYQGDQEYAVNCNITPLIHFNYLQIDVEFYDSDDTLLEQSSEVWNLNSPDADKPIDVQGSTHVNAQDPPDYTVIYVYKNFNRNPGDEIYNETINLTNTEATT